MVLAGFCEENTAYFRRIWLNVVWKFTKSKKNDKKDCSEKCFVLRKDVFLAISQDLIFQKNEKLNSSDLICSSIHAKLAALIIIIIIAHISPQAAHFSLSFFPFSSSHAQ